MTMNNTVFGRRLPLLLAAAITFLLPAIARAQCATVAEEGRWKNLDDKGDPLYLDIKMLGCGDQVLNGAQTETTHFTMQAWNRVVAGGFHARPIKDAHYKPFKGHQWLYAPLPNIPYMDHTWVEAVQRDGKAQLHVLIRHDPLDKRPTYTSEYWFIRSK
jgi:hypothetical protein